MIQIIKTLLINKLIKIIFVSYLLINIYNYFMDLILTISL